MTATDFERQYSHTYASRLDALKQRAATSANSKWTDLKITKRVIDLKVNTECMLIGTLFKTMALKPNVLEEYMESSIMAGRKPALASYVSDEDSLVVEDPTGRVVVTLDSESLLRVEPAQLVSGIVVGIRGFMQETGELLARDICFPSPYDDSSSAASASSSSSSSSSSSPPSTFESGTVMLISGIRVNPGMTSKLLPLQLLSDYVTGHVGDPSSQTTSSADIVRVVVCGNTVDMQSALEKADDSAKHGEDTPSSSSSSSGGTSSQTTIETEAEPLRVADNLLAQLARSVSVDVMPGPDGKFLFCFFLS
jgi:DNA polymerase delta subunit 2